MSPAFSISIDGAIRDIQSQDELARLIAENLRHKDNEINTCAVIMRAEAINGLVMPELPMDFADQLEILIKSKGEEMEGAEIFADQNIFPDIKALRTNPKALPEGQMFNFSVGILRGEFMKSSELINSLANLVLDLPKRDNN